jgi:hypothetical protein
MSSWRSLGSDEGRSRDSAGGLVELRKGYRYADTDTDRLRHDKFFVLFAEVSSEATMMDDDIDTHHGFCFGPGRWLSYYL